MKEIRHATYIGPALEVNVKPGLGALIGPCEKQGVVLAQFDGFEVVRKEEEPGKISFPVFQGYGWHEYPAEHFKLDEATNWEEAPVCSREQGFYQSNRGGPMSPIGVGDILQDNDKRTSNRQLRVVSVGDTHITACSRWDTSEFPKTTRIRKSRIKDAPSSKGFHRISAAQEAV